MKREYLFRAKKYSGDDDNPYEEGWEYGDLLKDEWFTYGMVEGNDSDLCPETIGQWSGLMDSDGRLIYEGDVMRMHDHRDNAYIGVVKFSKGRFFVTCQEVIIGGNSLLDRELSYFNIDLSNMGRFDTIIGNIWEGEYTKLRDIPQMMAL